MLVKDPVRYATIGGEKGATVHKRNNLMRTGAGLIAFALGLSASPVTQAAFAQNIAQEAAPVKLDKKRVERALKDMVSSGRAAGVSMLVWQDGRERYFGSAGYADRETRRPMTRDTLVQIWSMTKPVTGVALMQLWETGRFRIDDPLAQYLPEYAKVRVLEKAGAGGSAASRPADRPITIRDLLRHTAGLAYGMRGGPVDEAYKRIDPLNMQNDLAEANQRLASLPLLFDPGAEWSYSASVDVQARLVEKLSGQNFESYVSERILKPLGMRDTGWTQPAINLSRLAVTYQDNGGGALARQSDEQMHARNFAPRRLTMGGAGLVSSIDDYMRFARMLLNGGELDSVRVLKPSTVRLMATDHLDPAITERFFLPSKGSVGFGFNFAVRTAQPRNAAENRGAVGEFFWDGAASTLFWVDPANHLAAVFFVQKMPFDGTLHSDIRKAVYGEKYLGPKGD